MLRRAPGLEPVPVCCRYELERQLLDGKVTVSELPGLWNKRMTEYLGCTPKSDAEGILQVEKRSVVAMLCRMSEECVPEQ